MLWIDFETRSKCDLTVYGVYNYVLDVSTEVLCMSYAFDDEEVQTWTPDQEFPAGVRLYTGQIRAHNAAFERLVLWNLCGSRQKIEQFYCTAAQARANCLPGSLEDVGRAISSKMKKDHRGAQLIRALSMPRSDGTFNEDPALMAEMIAYCEQDVRTMRSVSKAMRDMSLLELTDYHINEYINDRGVLIDRPLVRAARKFANVEANEIHDTVREVTKGELVSVRSPKMREWVFDRVGPFARSLMQKDGKTSIDKSVRAALLAIDDPEEIPHEVMDVIQCADDIWASSVAKFQRLDNLADLEDDRVRGAFVFNGGSATGRASSYGAQVHNFTRKCAKEPEEVRHAMVRGHEIVPKYGRRVTDVLKGMLRPSLIPAEGKVFIVADWSAIEARANPWLSNKPMANDILDVFRNGGDIYIREAAGIFRKPESEITPDERQIGKVAILSLGYGGAVGAFNNMARNYGVVMSDNEAKRIVDAWRRSNQWAVNYWADLEDAYTRAVRNPKHEFKAGRVTYMHDGLHLWYSLPSKRILCYPFAKFEGSELTYVKAAWKPSADAKEWPRARLWRGLACIAEDTPVLTHLGWVPIQNVTAQHRIWDGAEWVSHEGLADQGYGRVIQAHGVTMTPDHKVLTVNGWVRADECERYSRASCRLPNCGSTGRVGWAAKIVARAMRLWRATDCKTSRFNESLQIRPPRIVRVQKERVFAGGSYNTRHVQTSGVCGLAVNARPMPFADTSVVGALWRARYICVRSLVIIREFLVRYGASIPNWADTRQNRQQRRLYTRKLQVDRLQNTSQKHSGKCAVGHAAWAHDVIRVIGENWHKFYDTTLPSDAGYNRSTTYRNSRRYAQVYDLINCGPRRRFVVKGESGQLLIVHNCENITQAVANDLLRNTLRHVKDVVLHVHDEAVLEVDKHEAEIRAQELKDIMCTPPEWAEGLPLNAEVKIMGRYGK